MIFVGVDWAEDDHDVTVMDPDGRLLGRARVAEGIEGVGRLHALVGEHAEDPGEVVVGIETDRGLLVASLVAAGYQVYAVNPRSVDRYRDRHGVSGAKSDGRDSKVLADMVRTDRHNLRPVAGDSDLAEAVKVTARAHQNLIWTRQRQINQLRSALREFYPGALAAFGTELAHPDALAVLAKAPTPELGRRLSASQIASVLRRGGRQRNIDKRAVVIRDALRAEQLAAPALTVDAYADTARALVAVITVLTARIADLESALADRFEQHPDAVILRSLAGLGIILGARCWASSGTTRTATNMLRAARTTPAPARTRDSPATARPCSPASSATGGSLTR